MEKQTLISTYQLVLYCQGMTNEEALQENAIFNVTFFFSELILVYWFCIPKFASCSSQNLSYLSRYYKSISIFLGKLSKIKIDSKERWAEEGAYQQRYPAC